MVEFLSNTLFFVFPYDKVVSAMVKELSGARYEPNSKSWYAPATRENIRKTLILCEDVGFVCDQIRDMREVLEIHETLAVNEPLIADPILLAVNNILRKQRTLLRCSKPDWLKIIRQISKKNKTTLITETPRKIAGATVITANKLSYGGETNDVVFIEGDFTKPSDVYKFVIFSNHACMWSHGDIDRELLLLGKKDMIRENWGLKRKLDRIKQEGVYYVVNQD
jgi:hypothetical protein